MAHWVRALASNPETHMAGEESHKLPSDSSTVAHMHHTHNKETNAIKIKDNFARLYFSHL